MGTVSEEERMEKRELTPGKWNVQQQCETRGECTRKLIPNINEWVQRTHGNVDFHLTQVLTGHGCFCSYLHRFKKRESPVCRYCEEEDTAAHTIFNRVRWTEERERVELCTGEVLNEATMVKVMLKKVENWRVVARFVREVMRTKGRTKDRSSRRKEGKE